MSGASPALTDRCRTVHVPVAILNRMDADAKRRSVSKEVLAFLVLEAVVEGGLIDAVLDDEEARSA